MTIIYKKEDFINYFNENKDNLLNNEKLDIFRENIKCIQNINKVKKYDRVRKIPKFKKINITTEEKYENEINSLLNKISPKIYTKIQTQLFDYYNLHEKDITNILVITINNIFKKAVIQPVYCPIYVKLINKINEIYDIKYILIEKCNEYKSSIMTENKKNADSMSEKEKYDIFCDNNKLKIFKEGYSQFIGELCNNEIITIEIINDFLNFFIDYLKKNIDKEHDDVESIITSIYKLLENCNKINIYNKKSIQDKLKNIDKNKLTKRLQFKLLDILEL